MPSSRSMILLRPGPVWNLQRRSRWASIVRMPNQFRMKTVGDRKVDAVDVWESVRQLTETAERLRGTRALVPRGVYRFRTFCEADEWMMEKMASTQASQGRKIPPESAKR